MFSIADEKISLRCLESKDLQYRINIFNEPSVFENMGFLEPLEIEKTIKWFDANKNNKSRIDCVFVDNASSVIVGMGGFVHLDAFHNNAELYIAISSAFQGKGLGKRSVALLCDLAFITIELNRIYLYTNCENKKASNLYKKIGFQYEGLLRRHVFKNGAYTDRLVFGLLKNEWLLIRSDKGKKL